MKLRNILELDDSLDSDSEIEISDIRYDSQPLLWIGKEEAERLITHLQKVFDLPQ